MSRPSAATLTNGSAGSANNPRFYRSVGHQGSELDIKMIGSWSRDTDNATLQTALLECLNGRTCNA